MLTSGDWDGGSVTLLQTSLKFKDKYLKKLNGMILWLLLMRPTICDACCLK